RWSKARTAAAPRALRIGQSSLPINHRQWPRRRSNRLRFIKSFAGWWPVGTRFPSCAEWPSAEPEQKWGRLPPCPATGKRPVHTGAFRITVREHHGWPIFIVDQPGALTKPQMEETEG